MRPSGDVLGASRGHLRRLGGHFGRLGGILEAILAVLEAILGVLGASWAVLRPSWASWKALRPSRGLLGSSWGLFGALFARFGALLGGVTVPEAHATHPGSARERPAAPGKPGVWALKKLQSWTSQGCMSLGALHFVPRARWRIQQPNKWLSHITSQYKNSDLNS